MSNTERDYESLVFRFEQLSQNQQVLAKYMAEMKRQLDGLNEQFNNLPELQQSTSLQDALSQLHRQFEQRSALPAAPVKVVNVPPEDDSYKDEIQPQSPQVQSYEYQLVFDRSGSRAVLMKALEKAQKRLIIVCPWLSRNSIDADLMQKLSDCLNRNCRIDIGWGFPRGRGKTGIGWGNSAIRDLKQLEQDYPGQFRLKLLGTHEKFLVCDSSFAMLGSHNMLTSNAQGFIREVGIRTTDTQIIQGLINRFDVGEVQDVQAIDEHLAESSVSLDDAEYLDAQYIGEASDTSFVNLDLDEPDEDKDSDDSAEDSQSPSIDAEEFLNRYKNQERDFTGIKLTRAKLSKQSFNNVKFSQANLSRAELCETSFSFVDLSQANLENANLRLARLYSINLVKASLKKANLSQANLLSPVDLSGANLTGANLIMANLYKVNLRQADLSHANLSHAYMLEANLEGANLQEVKLQGAICSTATIFPQGFDPVKAGAYLIAPNASLPKACLVGAVLSNIDATQANLSGANLSQVNLQSARLLQANLSAANLSEARLSGANLTAANLSGANLMQANLESANLSAANLSKAQLTNAQLKSTNLSGATLTEVNLVGLYLGSNIVNLSGADLSGANLCGTNLSYQNLSGVNLTKADLRGANLEKANLEKANLTGASLGGANLKDAKLSGAIMPDGTVHD